MNYQGDFDTSAVVYGKFTSRRPSTGASFTLAGSPVLSVYKDNSTTQSTTGVTLTADFDSVTGLNHYAIDTSADGTFYSAGSFFEVIITTGTVDSISVTGTVVGSFTIRKDSALKPTTAGRTLDVSATGEAGIDLANVGSPTTTLNLSGTTIKTATDVETDTADIQSRLPAALVSGRIDASVGAMAANTLTASALATDAVTEIQSGLATTANVAAVETDTQDIQSRLPAALVSGRIDASVGAMGALVLTSSAIATDAISAAAVSAAAVTKIQDGLATAAALATVDTVVDAIQVWTDRLGTAMVLDGSVYQFTANALELAPSGGGGSATLANQEIIIANQATILSAIDAVPTAAEMWGVTMSDLAAVPTATATVLAGLNLVYMATRNKYAETATTGTLYRDDGSTSMGTRTLSDDTTTFTRGEIG